MIELQFAEVASPVGAILIACDGQTLIALEFADHGERLMAGLRRRFGEFRVRRSRDPGGVASRIRAYLKGALGALDEIAADGGGTDFQRRVWSELRRIAPGEVVSYAGLARRIGRPSAVRAVANANAQNPVSIVVPCHRVIGSDGSLTGYGGGLPRKRWLLEHEGVGEDKLKAG